MQVRYKRNIFIRTLAVLLLVVSCKRKPSDSVLTLAVAANMQFAMEELIQDFNQRTGVSCDLVVSSSGKLAAQIREGAPYDVFVSADIQYPESLSREGFGLGAPKIYAYGSLVLWSLDRKIDSVFEVLAHPDTRHIAIANPETAPYGKAAMEVLQNLGYLNSVSGKLVYGESISQVNQFMYTGAADFGFTAQASVLSPPMQAKGYWLELPSNLYTPIAQGVLMLNSTQNQTLAKTFFDYLLSPEAADILMRYGYRTTMAESSN